LVQGDGADGSERSLGQRASADVLRNLDALDVWELDAVPVPPTEDESTGRACVLLLMVGEQLLDAHIASNPPSEPVEVAAWLAAWMERAVARLRAESGVDFPMPELMRVRHAAVADAMTPLLSGTRVEAARRLPHLDAAARGMRDGVHGDDNGQPDAGITLLSFPQTWSAWHLDDAPMRALLDAAARFHAARPWHRLADSEALSVHPSDAPARPWTACVLGAGGEEFGLVLYERDADYMRAFTLDDPNALLSGLEGAMVSLYFDGRLQLPRAMQQEFRTHGWTVAGPDAYPLLSCANTPAGGVSRAHVTLLTQTLDAVARLVVVPDLLPDDHLPLDTPVEWHDADTGLRLAYRGSRSPADVRVWPAPTLLRAGCATGFAADPNATFSREAATDDAMRAALEPETQRVERLAAWLENGRGERMRARASTTAQQHVTNAQLFIEHLAFGHGVTVAAMHEMHLRHFLYSWYPSHVGAGQRDAAGMLASLRQLFTWLELEGISCPWAASILDDREAMDVRLRTAPPPRIDEEDPAFGSAWWHDQFNADLYRRVMLPDPLFSDSPDDAGDWLGDKETLLVDELQALVLAWRESQIAGGVTDPETVRRFCTPMQRAWEQRPHARLGKSPAAIIRQERRKIEREDAGNRHEPW